ncbi:hypothetical protein Tco_0767910 [Tanacetum coccineum]
MNTFRHAIPARISEQVKIQLPQILPKEMSNFSLPVIKSMVTKSLKQAVLAKESSQSQSSYEACCNTYKKLIKSYDLDKTLFSTYDKVYSLKRSQKDKEKDEDPSAGPDRGLKKWETRKDVEPAKKEPEFEVADSDMPQNQEENPVNDDEEPKGKTPQKGQNQSWLMTLASTAKKPSKTFDELMSTLIDFSAFIMNGLKINNLTQETLLGPAFRLLKGTRSNYAELEYDFEECYKAFSEKLDWENPEGGDYPFDLTKPLPLVMSTKAAQYDLPCIEDMVPNIWVPVKVSYDKHALWEIVVRRAGNNLYRFKEGDFPRLHVNDIEDMLLLVVQNWLINISGDDISNFAIALRMFTRSLVVQKRVEDLQLGVESYQKKINVTKPETTKPGIRKKDLDRALVGLRTSLDDIAKNIQMEYLPKRRWSSLEKKRANIMIKAIDKQLKERRLMRSLEKFVSGRHYGTDLRLLQRTI